MSSQRDEDHWIADYFGDRTGTYLDLGAYDGKTFSNTRALAERGWHGVMVEPAAHAFAAMLLDPPPGARLVHAAVGPKTGLCSFMETRDAVSTTSRAHVRKWKQSVSFTPAFTVQVSVGDLLKEFPGPFNLISIDTEGTSMWVFHELAPRLEGLGTEMVIVEHDGAHPHLDGWHETYRSPENSILVRL